MKFSTLLRAGAALMLARPAILTARPPGVFRGRARTRDVAFQFRAGAGFPGRVNRSHPANIVPYLNDATSPVLLYGLACVVGSSNDVRGYQAGDTTAAAMFGVTVQPFPFQAATGSSFGGAAFGAAVPVPGLPVDVLKSGFIMVTVNGAPTLGSAVDVWFAASSGAHVQGGFEASHTGGSSVTLTNAYWNGPPDANGNAELAFNL